MTEPKRLTAADELVRHVDHLSDCGAGCDRCEEALAAVVARIDAMEAELAEQERLLVLAMRMRQVERTAKEAKLKAVREVCQWAAKFKTRYDALEAGRDLYQWQTAITILDILGDQP